MAAFIQFGSINSAPVNAFLLVIISAGILLSWKHGLLLAILSLLSIAGLGWIEAMYGTNTRGMREVVRNLASYLGIYLLTAGLVHITTRRIRDALDKAEKKAQELAVRNRQLEERRKNLEDRVEKRTREITSKKNFLQTLVDISVESGF